MALTIVAAKDLKDANDKTVDNKNKKAYTLEPKGIQDFFFAYRDHFTYYEIYRQLNPDGLSRVENRDLMYIQGFIETVEDFLYNSPNLENKIIDQFNLSFSKIRRYLKKLQALTSYALENADHLIGLGD